MNDTWVLIGSAIGLGAAYAAVPGAVNAEAMRRGIGRGFRPALLVQAGSLVGDVVWALVGISGAAMLVRFEALALTLGLIGAGFLLALARTAFVETFAGGRVPDSGGQSGGDFAVGFVFGLANPAGVAFWAGVGGGVLATGEGVATERAALFLAAFLVGASWWGCGMALLVAWGRRFTGARLFRWVNVLCGVALGWFGLGLLWSTVRRVDRLVPLAVRGWA